MEYVILVDEEDVQLGQAEKLRAHEEGTLHRACSVVLFNERGDILLQRRNPEKYHSGGRWSNTCCTHPRPGETAAAAAARRLVEEMGLDVDLEPAFTFIYRAELENGLVEHEFDHVFTGVTDEPPQPNADEVVAWRWASPDEIAADLERAPERYSPWFPMLFERLRREKGA